MRLPVRAFALSFLWLGSGAAFVPSNVHLSITEQSIVVVSNGHVLSTALVCNGFAFDQFGAGGPHLSPDQHWVLVDVRGPFAPGNVQRNHALVHVTSGRIAVGPDIAAYVGVPNTLGALAWASGERATLRYDNGSTAVVHDPPPHPIPPQRCAPIAGG